MTRLIIIKTNPYLDLPCQNFWGTRIKSHKHPGKEKQHTHTHTHTHTNDSYTDENNRSWFRLFLWCRNQYNKITEFYREMVQLKKCIPKWRVGSILTDVWFQKTYQLCILLEKLSKAILKLTNGLTRLRSSKRR